VLRAFIILPDLDFFGEFATFLLLGIIRVDQAKSEDWIFAHKREAFRLSDALTAVDENIVTAVNAIVNIVPADRTRLIRFFCMFYSCP